MTNLKNELSVIIPSFNGRERLPRILNSLESQTEKNFETLILIDGSQDGTIEYLEKNQFNLSDLKYHFTENIGRASIRNLGGKIANGKILVFYDDDMIPEPDSIQLHLSHHREFQNSILAGTQIDKYDENESNDFLKFKSFLSEKWMSKYGSKQKLDRENLFMSGANFSIPKFLFDELNGFDSRLNDAEDWDFVVKAFIRNVDIYLDPFNIGFHKDFITCRKYVNRRREYVKAQKKLNDLNHYIVQNGFSRLQEVKSNSLKKMIYSLFSQRVLVDLIDKGFFKYVFPRFLRYKLYDRVIVGLVKIFPNRKLM